MDRKHTPIHFEIPADDMERAVNFYKQLFGWDIKAAPGFEDYQMVNTQGLNGGMMKRTSPGMPIINYIDVEDIDKYLTKLEELGGQVLMPKMPIRGIGYNAVVKDSEGNVFGMMQEDKNAA